MRRLVSVLLVLLVGVLIVPSAGVQGASSYANPAFEAQWKAGEALAPNFWGPLANARDGQQEAYGGAVRTVQYFDKGRMELGAGGTVTNGLLGTELLTGRVQTGDATFDARPLAAVAVAGDLDARNPTYADVATRGAALLMPTDARTGETAKVLLTKESGLIPANVSYVQPPVAGRLTAYDDPTRHNVMDVFAEYRGRVGLATVGLAISEPFGASVYLGGEQTVVLVQAFERRVLTYRRVNPDPYKVEMGNIGQHYYQWRYGGGATPATTATTPTGTRAAVAALPTVVPTNTPTAPAKVGAAMMVAGVPARGTALNCSDFPSQAAQAYPDAPSGLDGDKDGIACERNPAPKDTGRVARA